MTTRKLVADRRVLLGSVSHLTFIGSDKGGVGKSLISALSTDLMEVAGYLARIIQIDGQDRLPQLFPGRVETVTLATLADARNDSSAVVAAFDPLYLGIERAIAEKYPLIVDIGGPQQSSLEEYAAMVDLGEDLDAAGIAAHFLIPTTAEPESMRAAVRTARNIGRVLPSVQRTVVLNGRDGPFRFYPNSPADTLWRDELEPLCRDVGSVKLPAITAGSWAPFEAAGKRFLDVVAADIEQIQAWTGRSRPAAKVIRGDVAAFVASADAALGKILGTAARGGSDAE